VLETAAVVVSAGAEVGVWMSTVPGSLEAVGGMNIVVVTEAGPPT
jgi:hypothetical protein